MVNNITVWGFTKKSLSEMNGYVMIILKPQFYFLWFQNVGLSTEGSIDCHISLVKTFFKKKIGQIGMGRSTLEHTVRHVS